MPIRVALVYSRIRVEEKLLHEALVARGIAVDLVDVRELVLDPQRSEAWLKYDLVIDRCIAHSQATAIVPLLESFGVRCLNRAAVTRCCGSKLETSLALLREGVPTLPIRVAVSPEAALKAIEELGYPVVLKPIVGSWGRLLAKVNDRDAAEAIIEHKDT
jgi:[lysine-biosynthesis-protein LysW]--L-2-aminoadipate ligase